MKTILKTLLVFVVLLNYNLLSAQVVRTITYQGVVIDDDGQPIANEPVAVSVSIDGSTFSASASAVTSELGAFSVDLEFPETVDFSQPINYTVSSSVSTSKGSASGTSPLSYVPAAIYALKAGSIDGVESLDSSATNEIQTLSIVGTLLSIIDAEGNIINSVNLPTSGGGSGDEDPNNEVQTLSANKNGNEITLGLTLTGEKVILNISDEDNDPNNEIQTITKNGNIVTLSNNGGNYIDDINDADADPINEIQTLSISGNMLTISDGNSVNIPSSGGSGDDDPNNEVQDLSSFESGDDITVEISLNGQSTTFSRADGDADNENEIEILSITPDSTTLELTSPNGLISSVNLGNLLGNDADADPTNEYQELVDNSDPGSTFEIGITDGNSVDFFNSLPDKSSSNEIQTLSLTGNTLELTPNGGTVDLSTTGQSSPWNQNGNDIYFDSGNVGIGLSNPSKPFEIVGNTKIDGIDIGFTSGSYSIFSQIGFPLNINGQTIGRFTDVELTNGLQLGSTALSNVGTIKADNCGLYVYADFCPGGPNFKQKHDLGSSRNSVIEWKRLAYVDELDGLLWGDGTFNYIPKFSGNSTGMINSDIYNSPNGYIGIGTTSPSDELEVIGDINASDDLLCGDAVIAGGSIVAGASLFLGGTSGITWSPSGSLNSTFTSSNVHPLVDNTKRLGQSTNRWTSVWATDGTINTSDARLKASITPLTSALETVSLLNPVSFEWISKRIDSKKELGFLAQDLIKAIPESVVTHEVEVGLDGTKKLVEVENLGVKYHVIIPVLTKAIQEQQTMIESQRNLLEKQNDKIEKLNKEIEEIKRIINN